MPLDEESTAMTTFSTPVGRYQCLRLPFGVVHAGDDYCGRVADIFDDIPNTRRVVEDILIFNTTWEEHVKSVHNLFHPPPPIAAKHNVSLSTKKLKFAQQTVRFGGYVVSENHFKPDPKLTERSAIFRLQRTAPISGHSSDSASRSETSPTGSLQHWDPWPLY